MSRHFQTETESLQRDPKTALVLSIIPGLGQVYNLEPRKGLLFFFVAALNLLLVAFLSLSAQISSTLTQFGESFNVTPNHILTETFSTMNLVSPPCALLFLLSALFIIFVARDAHDHALNQRRKAIYATSFVELSEANSASYLLHISLMVSSLILAFFFLIPPKPQTQITDIEFVAPQKKTEKQVRSKKASVHASEAVRDRRPISDRSPGKARSAKADTKPQTVSKAEPTRSSSAARPSQTNPRPRPQPRPVPTRASSARPSPPKVVTAPTMAGATQAPQLPDSKSQSSNSPPRPNSSLLAFAPRVNSPNLPVTMPNLSTGSGTKSPAPPTSKAGNQSTGSKVGAGEIAPSIIPVSSGSGTGPRSERSLAPVGTNRSKSGSGKDNNQPGPQPARSKSTAGGGMKNLISIKPSVGSPRTAAHSGPAKSSEGDGGNPESDKIEDQPNIKNRPEPYFGAYMAQLQRRIKQNWFPAREERSKRVKVIFTIHENGTMSNLRLERSSGSSIADQAALKAVRNSAPFAHLPKYSPPSVDVSFTFDYNVFHGGGTRRF